MGHHMTAGFEYTRDALLDGDIACCRCLTEEVDDAIRDADVVVPLMTSITAHVRHLVLWITLV